MNLKNKSIGKLEALKKEHADYDVELGMLLEKAEKAEKKKMLIRYFTEELEEVKGL